jgi:hypothetical protein
MFLIANAGVPLFTTNVYWQVILLIPIVLIELLVHRQILKIRFLRSLKLSLLTNLLSTLIGFIVVFAFAFLFGVSDSFHPPLDTRLTQFLVLRTVGFLLMGLISVRSEYWLGSRLCKEVTKEKLKKSFLTANILSYILLAIAMAATITTSLSTARHSMSTIAQDLAEFDRVCPVIVKSDACDRAFQPRLDLYEQQRNIYKKHNSIPKYFDSINQATQLRSKTAKTCSPNDPRTVCSKAK